jgi:hypothetical protein
MSYPAYQCFKTTEDRVYCSKTKVKSHAVGARWVGDCMSHHNIQSAHIRGRPYTSNHQPDSAIIYPE